MFLEMNQWPLLALLRLSGEGGVDQRRVIRVAPMAARQITGAYFTSAAATRLYDPPFGLTERPFLYARAPSAEPCRGSSPARD